MSQPRRVRPFTPGKEPAATLASRTVGRDTVLDLLDRRLLAVATTRNRPHTLLVGPRGAGKTHLVEVALHHAGKRAEFRERVAIVRLDEDLVGISRYRDVLREVLARLPIGNGAQGARPIDLEAAIAHALGGRTLVLVIENLDMLFQSLGTAGQQDLRAWVENSRSVMLLATTPLLFPGVQDRNQPWYGNLGISHLEELGVEDGAQLLTHIARERGDDKLAAFLQTERGFARLQAINHLAGGSPRVWMILSDCISVELLDELSPAVEALMEGLVPYYQQLLWALSANEQRLVRALANGSVQAMTVTMLADETEIDPRSAAMSLGRLARARWVRAEKPSGLDQRATWYRLREPLLRHHLHYRSAVDQPLPLIVDLLRAWFEPRERRNYLLGAEPGSSTELLLARSLSLEPHRFDSAYAERDVNSLLLDARRWITGAEAASRTPEVGALIEFGVLLARNHQDLARNPLETRVRAGAASYLLAVIDEDIELSAAADEAGRVGMALATLVQRVTGRTHDILELVSACWDGARDPAQARDRLLRLDAAMTDPLPDDLLVLDVRQELAFWTGEAGKPATARDQYAALLPDRVRVLGPDHPDTLSTRANLADWTGEAGDPAAARDQYAALLPDRVRVLGPDHLDTLSTRANLAHWTGEAGKPATARDQYAALLPDRVRVLGPDHPDTLSTRANLAHWTGEAGDPAAARDQYTALLPDRVRVLSPDHPDNLSTRANLAHWTGEAGDPAAARDQYTALLPDRVRVLSPDHPDNLSTRANLAHWTGEAGDPAAARDQYTALLPDLVRVLSPDNLSTRANLAHWTGEAGDPAAARDQYTALLPDLVRVLGPDHPDNLTTRANLARWTGRAREPATARDQYTALLPDLVRVLGPDHPDTLTTRANLAHWTGQAGDPATARDQYTALLPDQVRIAGPDSAIAVRTYTELLRWTSRAGQPAHAVQHFIALSSTDHVVADDVLRTTVEDALGGALLTFLDRASRDQADPIDDQLPAAAFLADLRAALTGDLEALARTPAELVSIITEIRERHSEPAPESPSPSEDVS